MSKQKYHQLVMRVPSKECIHAPSHLRGPEELPDFVERELVETNATVSFEDDGVSNPQTVTSYFRGYFQYIKVSD